MNSSEINAYVSELKAFGPLREKESNVNISFVFSGPVMVIVLMTTGLIYKKRLEEI